MNGTQDGTRGQNDVELREKRPEDIHAHFKNLVELFTRLNFREYWARVNAGLRSARDSGEHKWARLQILRLWAPTAGLVGPLLVLLILVTVRIAQPPGEPIPVRPMDPTTKVDLDPPEPDPAPPIEPPDPAPVDVTDPTPGYADAPSESAGADVAFSPVPTELPGVAIIKSPVVFPGILGSRTPGERGKILGRGPSRGVGTEVAVLRALRWLKKYQDYDGSWAPEAGGGAASSAVRPAMTGMALLTFLSHGETPASDEFGPTVEKAMQWLVAAQDAGGQFAGRDRSDYTQPICAYALCEAFTMTRVPMLRQAAEKAIERVLNGQQATGGFNYNLNPSEGRRDTSYTAWCIQALKAAAGAELYQRDRISEALKKAGAGMRNNAVAGGGFGYTNTENTSPYLTSAAVLGLQLSGAVNDGATRAGLRAMDAYTCNWQTPMGRSPIYYWYYTTQAKFHSGGDAWNRWNAQFSPAIANSQIIVRKAIEGADGKLKDIGYWSAAAGSELCTSYVYNTTLCALMLQVYYRYLPTYKTPEASAGEDITIEDTRKDVEVRIHGQVL